MGCIAKQLGMKTTHGGKVSCRKLIRPVDSPSWITVEWCEKHFKELREQ